MKLPGLTIPCVLWMMSKPLVHLCFHCCLLYHPHTVWKFIFFKYSALATFLLLCFNALTTAEREGLLFFFSYIQRDMDCHDRKGSGSSRNLAVHIFINMQRMQGRRKGKEEKRKGEGRKEEVKKEKSRTDEGEKRRVGEWEEKRKRGELGLGQGYVCSEPTLMTYFLQQDTTSAVPPTRD